MAELQEFRIALVEFVNEMKANDLITEKLASIYLSQVATASSLKDLMEVKNMLPKIGPASIEALPAEDRGVIRRVANMGEIKLVDEWVKGKRYLIEGKMADIKIDLLAYEDAEGMDLEIEFDINFGDAKINLPYSWQVIDEIEEKATGEVKIKGDLDGVIPRNRLVICGAIRMSGLKIKYKD